MLATTLLCGLVVGAVGMRANAALGDNRTSEASRQGSAAWRCEAPQQRLAPAGANVISEFSLARTVGAKVADPTPAPEYPLKAATAGCDDQTLRVRVTVGTGGTVLKLVPVERKPARGMCNEVFLAELERTLKHWRFEPAEELPEPTSPQATRQRSVGEVTCSIAFRRQQGQRP